MVKPISADDKSNLRRAGAISLALTLASFWHRILRRRLFQPHSQGLPVYAEAPHLKVELLEQLIGELQNQREFTRRDPARLRKFVANGISDMDGRS